LLRLRNRHGLADMKLSSFVAVAEAHYRAFSKKIDQKYQDERSLHAPNSPIVWLADLVAGAPNAADLASAQTDETNQTEGVK
ncbi:hypothetical protein, partial [Salmonella sp. 15E557]|uniref:hypothetical protein n=1 Tax=Salmonella sp. 15E557 TaxID=2933325 RepID=UPI001FF6C692